MPERLVIKNLPPDMGEDDLLALLSRICAAELLSGPEGEWVSRGAIVQVATHDEAGRIVQGLDGQIVNGHRVNVEWTRPGLPGVRWEVQSEERMPGRPPPHRPQERPHRPERSPGR